jgi:hypothetical protein
VLPRWGSRGCRTALPRLLQKLQQLLGCVVGRSLLLLKRSLADTTSVLVRLGLVR